MAMNEAQRRAVVRVLRRLVTTGVAHDIAEGRRPVEELLRACLQVAPAATKEEIADLVRATQEWARHEAASLRAQVERWEREVQRRKWEQEQE